ncbi:UNVERIFIED_CONTAM: hypothetical protein ODW78_09640, partial [Salmonella enterica subsp. enterica serovar Enteritidis]
PPTQLAIPCHPRTSFPHSETQIESTKHNGALRMKIQSDLTNSPNQQGSNMNPSTGKADLM